MTYKRTDPFLLTFNAYSNKFTYDESSILISYPHLYVVKILKPNDGNSYHIFALRAAGTLRKPNVKTYHRSHIPGGLFLRHSTRQLHGYQFDARNISFTANPTTVSFCITINHLIIMFGFVLFLSTHHFLNTHCLLH